MAQGQAQRLRVFTPDLTLKAAWQSYWVGETVENHSFLTYETGVIVTSNTGDSQTLEVVLPASGDLQDFIDTAYRDGYLFETEILQFDSASTLVPPPYYTVAQYVGTIESARTDGVSISLTLGNSLNPVGAQVPPRRFTTDRIGTPLRL